MRHVQLLHLLHFLSCATLFYTNVTNHTIKQSQKNKILNTDTQKPTKINQMLQGTIVTSLLDVKVPKISLEIFYEVVVVRGRGDGDAAGGTECLYCQWR